MRYGRNSVVSAVAVWVLAACQISGPVELAALAERPPLTYSVLVTGGAFLEVPDDAAARPLGRTFADHAQGAEAVGLDEVVAVLELARSFARLERDVRSRETRAAVARSGGLVDDEAEASRQLLATARRDGHDYALIVQKLRDGPVEDYGISDHWPLCGLLWVLVGLGALVPDHTFESRATLHVTLRDLHSGRAVYSTVLGGASVELALFDRGNAWGLVQSILIPPFWVGSDPDNVRAEVRAVAVQRLLFSLARDVKGVACRTALSAAAPARLRMERVAGGLLLRVQAVESLSFARLRLVAGDADQPALRELEAQLLRSEAFDGREFLYSVRIAHDLGGQLQVLVQTVAGRSTSATFGMGDL